MTTRLAPSPYRCACCARDTYVASDHPRAESLRRNYVCAPCDDFLQAQIAAMSDYDLDSAIVADLDELDREYFDNREATK